MQLGKLLSGMEYSLVRGSLDTEIDSLRNNTKNVTAGCIFFCICGAKFDGHTFAEEVVKNGAAAIIVEKDVELSDEYKDVAVVKVKSTRYAMAAVSANFYGEPSKKMTVIGITGTKGKTTTAYMIRSMLEKSGRKTGLIGTIEILYGDTQITAEHTTPESMDLQKILADMADAGMDSVVMEVSSQGLMLDRVAAIDFDYGIFTNLSEDHIGPGEHSSFEEYRDWKKKLFTMCKCGLFNADDENSSLMQDGATCKIVTYGLKDADYVASNQKLFRTDGALGISYHLAGKATGEVTVNIPGLFSVYNSLAAIALATEMGIDPETSLAALKQVRVRGRVELVPISTKFTMLIDYAHNAVSLESLLNTLREYKPKRLITVFGCGGNRDRNRRYTMGEVSGRLADLSIITSDNPRFEEPQAIIDDILVGIGKTDGKYIEIIDRKEAFRYAILNAKEDDLIVLAGKGHETYQEIKGVKYPMDERELIREVLEEEDVSKICGYHN